MKRPASAALSSSDRTERQTSCSGAELPATALRSFFSSAASRNSGSAVQPGVASTSGSTAASSSSGNAERVANVSARSSSAALPATLSQSKILSMQDVQRWLAEPHIVRCHSADLERLKEAAAVLSRSKPRQEDVRKLQNDWQVSSRKPLPGVIQEFRNKIIKAAQKMQQRLLDSAEPPASSGVEQSARMDTTEVVDFQHDPMLTRFKDRQSKRAEDSAADQQRPLAKPKATKGRNKRAAATTCDSVEQPVSKRKDRLLTQDLFALGACDHSDPGAPSFDSAVQPAPVRHQREIMSRLVQELRKLSTTAWVVGDADARRKDMISIAWDLQNMPTTQRTLTKRSMTVLYTGICGAMKAGEHSMHGGWQDYTHVSMTTSFALERQALQFVQAIDEIEEGSMDAYPCLWELKNREHDALLNGLPDMPRSPQQLFEMLKDTEASASTPFGRLPAGAQAQPPFRKCPEYFVRMLACVELPNLRPLEDLPIPKHHAELIDTVVQHRSNAAVASAGQPAHITASDIKDTLQDFSNDSYSCYAKKRWLWDVLKVPKEQRQDSEYLPQLFETAVDEFLQELHANQITGSSRSKHTLAVLALYHRILITWKKKNTAPMVMAPMFRMLANAEGTSRKQYLPQDQCGEDVELAANRMPAYWTRMQKSAGQPVDDLSLPVARWCSLGFVRAGFFHRLRPPSAPSARSITKRFYW